jgi:hypothetical protein
MATLTVACNGSQQSQQNGCKPTTSTVQRLSVIPSAPAGLTLPTGCVSGDGWCPPTRWHPARSTSACCGRCAARTSPSSPLRCAQSAPPAALLVCLPPSLHCQWWCPGRCPCADSSLNGRDVAVCGLVSTNCRPRLQNSLTLLLLLLQLCQRPAVGAGVAGRVPFASCCNMSISLVFSVQTLKELGGYMGNSTIDTND